VQNKSTNTARRRPTAGVGPTIDRDDGLMEEVRDENRILACLPAEDRARLMAKLSPVFLRVKTVLFEPGQLVDAVYFPLDGVISLVTPLEDGAIVEVATVGNEGVVGVPLIFGGTLAVRAISQVAGRCLTMSAEALLEAMRASTPITQLVQTYVLALFGQISQAAACNRLHTNEERLSRWLLMSHDRIGSDKFLITQEFLAQMLGSRRATVTLSAGILQKAGLIHYHRGHVEIVDRAGLENVSCECYRVIKTELDKVTASPVFAPIAATA
jgi:CRP-like cAMP-binding protein